jgi:chlorobactene glucosyltransferase
VTDHWPAWLAAGAWVLAIAATLWRFRDSRRLDDHPATLPPDAPLVSVIIPARDEAHNIGRCLRSVLATTWPALEVIVVDDHSADDTAEVARRIAAEDGARRAREGSAVPGAPPRVRVVPAPDLPAGWFGKQWACHTGAGAARGALLCFTDADTRHGRELLARSVNALTARGADLFTVAGRQDMLTFWEKVVQPVVFATLLARYGGTEAMSRSTRPLDKIANGQFILVRRDAYHRAGGHAAVRGHVAEDLRLAQRFTELGMSAQMMLAQDHLRTRMYTSLEDLRRGWGKNVYAAGRDTLPLNAFTRRVLPFVFPVPALLPAVPAIVLALACLGVLGAGARIFGTVALAANVFYWSGVYAYARLNPLWGLLHPLGSVVFAWICIEAAWKGSRVEWKGRAYESRG